MTTITHLNLPPAPLDVSQSTSLTDTSTASLSFVLLDSVNRLPPKLHLPQSPDSSISVMMRNILPVLFSLALLSVSSVDAWLAKGANGYLVSESVQFQGNVSLVAPSAVASSQVIDVWSTITQLQLTVSQLQAALAVSQPLLPTTQMFLSGNGTYVLPSSLRRPLYLRVQMAGGGGGGGAGELAYLSAANSGGVGGSTKFGSALTAYGGAGGLTAPAPGGLVNQASFAGIAIPGGSSQGAPDLPLGLAYFQVVGGSGGGTPLSAGAAGSGANGTANTGAGGGGVEGREGADEYAGGGDGGGGSSYTPTFSASAGGGGGGYLDVIIPSPASTYTYQVGAGGAGGNPGAAFLGGSKGGYGGSGILFVTEYYQ